MNTALVQKPEPLNHKIVSLICNVPAYLLIGYVLWQYYQGVPNDTILYTWKQYRDLAYSGYLVIILGLSAYIYTTRQSSRSVSPLHTSASAVSSNANTYVARIAVSLLLITFSYAIAGLVIDIYLMLRYVIGM